MMNHSMRCAEGSQFFLPVGSGSKYSILVDSINCKQEIFEEKLEKAAKAYILMKHTSVYVLPCMVLAAEEVHT